MCVCVLTCAYILYVMLLHDTTCISTIMMSSDIIMDVVTSSGSTSLREYKITSSVKYCNLHVNGTDGAYF